MVLGSGKSSLIKSIVQLCKDIVHVDPIEEPQRSTAARRRSRTITRSGVTLSEIYASTKPYPPWWSDLEDSRVLRRRRKSTNDVVLERNLCFVDGSSGSTVSRAGETRAMIYYMKQQLSRAIAAVGTTSTDLRNMLGGNGGSQVDAVLYLMSEGKTLLPFVALRIRLTELCRLASHRHRVHAGVVASQQRNPSDRQSGPLVRGSDLGSQVPIPDTCGEW